MKDLLSPRFWFGSFVGLVLLTGLCAGVVVDRLWLQPAPAAFRPPGPGPMGPPPPGGPPPERLVADLDTELHFTADQRRQVLAILEARRPKLRAIQDETRQRFIDEQQALQKDIAATLTPEQATHFAQMMANRPPDHPFGPGPGPGGRGRPGGPGRRDQE